MKEIKDPVKEVNRLSVLMAVYLLLYAAAVILAIISIAVGGLIPLIVIGVICAVLGIAIDIYVRVKRAKLNNRLNAEFKAAGIDVNKLEAARRGKRR